MLAVIDLVLPLFGLVFLGYLSGKLTRLPAEGLAWMNFFIVYIALPAMFYKLLATTPVEQFANVSFIAVSVLATFVIFCFGLSLGLWSGRGDLPGATIQGLAAAYGNIGYMGPPLALAAFGPAAGVPVALIFCFENAMHFTMAPLLMAVDEKGEHHWTALLGQILRKIFTHPFILATIAGVTASVFQFRPPTVLDQFIDLLAQSAGPCALFVMGVTAALRPLKR
ncbi:MAG: AEC family transporter, partial [Gammaproteobacteria bacterium]|nr:AEC family transporter [Gammaproteobacteria bacterium]